MKHDKSKYYLDLSKCSEGEIKEVGRVIIKNAEPIGFHTSRRLLNGNLTVDDVFLYFNIGFKEWNIWPNKLKAKTEISLQDFKELFASEEPYSRGQEKCEYTAEEMEKAYRAGENKSTYRLKDTTVILPTSYEGIEG